MQRRLTLTGPDDRQVYRFLLTGWLGGGDPQKSKGKKELIFQRTRIKKVLMSAGEMVEIEAILDAERGAVLQDCVQLPNDHWHRLREGSHVLTMYQADWCEVEQHIVNVGWMDSVVDQVADVLDRLSRMDDVTDEGKG